MTDSETAWELNFQQFREAPMWLEANGLVNGQTQVQEVTDLGSTWAGFQGFQDRLDLFLDLPMN